MKNTLQSRNNREKAASAPLLETLYKNQKNKLFKMIMRLSGNNYHLSEDIISTTFLSCSKNLQRLKNHPKPEALLLCIARNKFIDHIRKEQVMKKTMEKHCSLAVGINCTTPEEEWQQHIYIKTLVQKLNTMTPRYRKLLTWKYLENKSCKDIAILTGKTIKAVASSLYRAKIALKDQFFLPERW